MILRECQRFFRSSPLLSAVGIALLAVGVGSSAIAFSMLRVFSAPRFPGVRFQAYATIGEGSSLSMEMPVPWNRFDDLRNGNSGGIRLAAYSPAGDVELAQSDTRKNIKVAAISGEFFSTIAAPLAAGRDFTAGEAETPGRHLVILGAALATSLFGSAQGAPGQLVMLNGLPYEVTGVAPASFRGVFEDSAEAWVPANCVIPLRLNLPSGASAPTGIWRVLNSFYVLAASEHLSSAQLFGELDHMLPLRPSGKSPLEAGQGISIDPGRDETVRRWLRLGLGFSLGLALVSCLNVCLLLLSRAPLLVEEVRLKRALGADSRRIAMELAMGPVAMMALGLLASSVLWAGGLIAVSRVSHLHADLLLASVRPVLGGLALQLALAFVPMVGAALIPGFAVLHSSANPRMGTTATISRRTTLLMQGQVAVQIACGICIAVVAGMIGASLLALMHQPLGYQPARRLVVCIAPKEGSVVFTGSDGVSPSFLALNRVIDKLRTAPGIRSVGYVDAAPFDGESAVDDLENPATPSILPRSARHVIVTSGYLDTIGASFVRGRDVAPWSQGGGSNEVVLSRSLADALFPGQNPIGRTLHVVVPARSGLHRNAYPVSVAGVVQDLRDAGYASSPQPTFFEEGHAYSDARPHLVVYGDVAANTLEQQASEAVRQLMPGMSVERVYDLSAAVSASLAPDRNRAWGALAGAGMMGAVAFIGLYGSLTFYLRTNRRAMAIRICLGASPWAIRRMVLSRALWCSAAAAVLSLPSWIMLRLYADSNYLGKASWSSSRAAEITLLTVGLSLVLALVPAAAAISISPAGVLKEQG